MHGSPYQTLLAGLRQAIPYLRLFRNKTFVIKVGGRVVGEPDRLRALIDQVGTLIELGIRVVLVHGGGPQTTDLAKRLGLDAKMVDGRRVTDRATLEAAVMAMNGTARTTILAACRAAGVPAVGLSGIDAGLIRAVRRPAEPVDFGEVGDIVGTNPDVLQHMLPHGTLPVISPLSADESGRVLNVNADTVAARIACAIKAAKLLFVGETAGLLEDPLDPVSLISLTDLNGLEQYLAQGSVDTGMLPKVAATREALRGGVERVHMLSADDDGLLAEVFTNEGVGTLIVRTLSEVTPGEAQAVQPSASGTGVLTRVSGRKPAASQPSMARPGSGESAAGGNP